MSRLIVKNLPSKVDSAKLREKFSAKGDVTDVQLRFTSGGQFRKFAFIGYKTEEQAKAALKYFDNTFYDTAKIRVELCSSLGDGDKPRSWSKHTKIGSDIISQRQSNTIINQDKVKVENEKNKSFMRERKSKIQVDKELLKKIEKHKCDPEFREFLEIHGDADKILELCQKNKDSDLGEAETDEKEEVKKEKISVAHLQISDKEYLKLKMKGATSVEPEKPIEEKIQEKLFTVKIKNLPKGIKKHDIRELLKPLMPASVRRARGLLGLAYIGFKSEKDMKKALIKNKTFLKGKQLFVTECVDSKPDEKEIPLKWKQQEEGLADEESIGESGRIFLRNLFYSVTEEEIEALFSKFGPLSEVSLPIDKLTKKCKGYGTVTFVFPEHAVAAYTSLDGTVFQGRMLHILPAKAKDTQEEPETNNYKQMKQAKLKKTASQSHNWNTLFLGRNAVADVVAETYKTSKQDVLTGQEGAVRLALGETQLVHSTREFLVQNGIHLDAFNQHVDKRSKNIILVKNLPANTTSDEMKSKFEKFGSLGRVILPPSGIMAVVEFIHPTEAKSAFMKLAYTKFKTLPLYLEWAPQNTFVNNKEGEGQSVEVTKETLENPPKSEDKNDEHTDEMSDEEAEPEPDTTLYVKNLSFDTNETDLKKHFSSCGKLSSVTISKKKDPKHPGKLLSLGYGFIQYFLKTSISKALAELQGSQLGGHNLELKRSDRTSKPLSVLPRKATNTKKQTGSKILVRNIPFQADIREIKQLFGTFGEIKSVRMPKKLIGTGKHRGFGFVEFSTKHEAKAAMKALSQSTHLYGRRLVLEWAALDDDQVDSIRKRTAEHFHDNQPLSGNKRKALANLDIAESDEED